MEHLEEIIENIRMATFHMDDSEAIRVIDMFILSNPELLEYHDKQWYYDNC